MKKLLLATLTVSVLGGFGLVQQSAASPTAAYSGSSTSESAFDSYISSSDLIEIGQSSLASSSYTGEFAENGKAAQDGAATSHDGTNNGIDPHNVFIDYSGQSTSSALFTLTLNLDPLTGGSAAGYTLQEVQSISGYYAGFGGQDFTLSVETVGSTTFTQLGGAFATNLGALSNRTVVTDTTGSLASHVAAIQVNYTGGEGATSLRELDIFGEATPAVAVPEPATYALLVGGLVVMGLYVRRRRA